MAKQDTGNRDFSERAGVAIEDVTRLQLFESLRRCVCPMCGGVKKPYATLCFGDYKRLSHGQQMALYDRIGEGYEEAVKAAFMVRGVTSFILPEAGKDLTLVCGPTCGCGKNFVGTPGETAACPHCGRLWGRVPTVLT